MTADELLLLITEYETAGIDDALAADTSLESLVAIYDCLERGKQSLTRTLEHLTEVLVPVVPPGGEVIEGIGRIEAKPRAGGEKWDGEALLALLVAQAQDEIVDRETGEVLEHPGQAVARVIAECSGVTNPSHKWRVGAVKPRIEAAGRTLDEYRSVGAWKDGVRLTRIEQKGEAAA